MNSARFRWLAVVLLAVCLAAASSPAEGRSPQAQPNTHPNEVYPQIVRVSYVEGDVRVSRGKAGEKATGATWEKAAAGLPLETGFSLVTGKGRAEIEFEDASTLYLGEDSVLVCNELSTTAGVPRTDLGLLSGVITEDVQPMVPGEWFIVRTPTDSLSVRYPERVFLRVNSYLDAIAVTVQDDGSSPAHESRLMRTWRGKTLMFQHARRVDGIALPDPVASVEWDGWVMARVEQRAAAMAAMMKESGLTEPVPGLAEMQGQGSFFACPPYGMCWKPANGWGGKEMQPAPAEQKTADTAAVEDARQAPVRMDAVQRLPMRAVRGADGGMRPIAEQVSQAAYVDAAVQVDQAGQVIPAAQVGQAGPLVDQYGDILSLEDEFFPCSPWRVRYLMMMDPLTRRETMIGSEDYLDGYSWEWAVCHTGSWIRREHSYAWVPGRKRHHHRPVRWVKYAGRNGYVPIHPRDVAGKPPLNLKYGLFVAEKNGAVERIEFDPARPVKVLPEAPKEFRKDYFPMLARAEAPRMEARTLGVGMPAGREMMNKELAGKGAVGKESAGRASETPITFNRKTQSFSAAREVVEGGRVSTMAQTFGSAQSRTFGSAQARGGGGFEGARGGGGMASAGRTGNSGGGFSRGSSGGGGGEASHGGSMSAPSGGGGASSGGGAAAGGARK